MTETFVVEKFKQVFRSYYLKRCILCGVLWCVCLSYTMYRVFGNVESSIDVQGMMATGKIAVAGLVATGAIAIGGGFAGGIIAIGVLEQLV